MKRFVKSLAFGAVLIAGVTGHQNCAQAVGILNGSFEFNTPSSDPSPFKTLGSGSTEIDGWTVGGHSIDYIGSYWQAADGKRSLDMNGIGPGSISQNITGLIKGQQYTVSFSLAGNPDAGDPNKILAVNVGLGAHTYTFNITGKTHTAMGWVPQTLVFTAAGTSALLTFRGAMTGSWGPALDNVSIAATPLPAALPLFGSALAGWWLLGRLRRRRTATA